MIKVLFVPQVNEVDKLSYKFDGEKITAYFNDKADLFDFSPMPEGAIGEVESELPVPVVKGVYRKDGILHVKLLNFISLDATKEEKFPEWVVK